LIYKADKKIKDLYSKMAKLTLSKCSGGCLIRLGYCCSPEYCELAVEYAKEHGIELKETKNEKGCLVEPWLRPLCTLHICERLLFQDEEFSKKYFDLREQIEVYEEELLSKDIKKKAP
jgi:hypothetical protein